MNLKNNPTVDQLKALVSACDDKTFRHLICVDKDWNVSIEEFPDTTPVSEWKRRKGDQYIGFGGEIWQRGKGYTGPDAAADELHMNSLFNDLIKFRDGEFQSLIERD